MNGGSKKIARSRSGWSSRRFSTPIANVPRFVQHLTLLDPLRYLMVVLRGVFLEGTPFHLLLDQFRPLALIGVVNLALAGWLFRHRLY